MQGFTMLKFAKVLCMQGLKMQLFRVCACRNSKCFNFQNLAIFKVLCMQGFKNSYFLGFCACRSSTCFIFQGCVHERAPNAARSASLSRDFVHARLPHASISRDFGTQGLQMLCPEILCMEGVEMLQLQGQNALIAKDSNVQTSQILRASLEHLSALPAWFQKRLFWANFDPDVGDPSCQYNPLIFYRAYSGRGRITNLYKHAPTYLIPGESNMYSFSARW